jgi:hypothetical protein
MARYTLAKPKNRYTLAQADTKKPVSSPTTKQSFTFDILSPEQPVNTLPLIQNTPEKERELGPLGLPKTYLTQGTKTPDKQLPQDSFWEKTAKFVLPKPAERFFGLDKTPEQKQIAQDIETGYGNKWAREDLQRLYQAIDPETGKLKPRTTKDVLKSKSGQDYIPFFSGKEKITEALDMWGAVKRLKAGETTPQDDYLLAKMKAESERDSTFGAKVTGILTELPSFAGELLLTSGIYGTTKKLVEKGVKEGFETAAEKTARRLAIEGFVTKAIGATAGATAQTPFARGLNITAETIRNLTPEYQYGPNEDGEFAAFISKEGDGAFEATAKAFTNQWVEVVSEHTGGAFKYLTNPVKNKIMKTALFKTFLKNNPNISSSQFINLVNKAGWNGVLEEMGEERVGEVMRGILTEVGLSEEGFTFPSADQLAVELVAFMIPGAAIAGVNQLKQGDGSFQQPQAPQQNVGETPLPQAGTTQVSQPLFEGGSEVAQTQQQAQITQNLDEYKPKYRESIQNIDRIGGKMEASNLESSYRDQLSGLKPSSLEYKRIKTLADEVKQDIMNYEDAVQKDLKSAKVSREVASQDVPKDTGPGFKRMSNSLNRMVNSGTLLPEDVTILETLFENTDDSFLGKLDYTQNGRLTRSLGKFRQKSVMGERQHNWGEIQLQKGIASNDSAIASRVFSHEFGHAGYYMILDKNERAIVDSVFRNLGKQGRRTLFQGGLANHPNYHASDSAEFFAESFAEYVFSNKVPAEQMEPLLKKVARKFFEGLKRLVTRGNIDAMSRMTPLYEKILAGKSETPLAEFAEKQPPRFNTELLNLFKQNQTQSEGEPPIEEAYPVDQYPEAGKIEIPNSIKGQPVEESKYRQSIQQKILDARQAEGLFDDFVTVAPNLEELDHPVQRAQIRDLGSAIKMPQKVTEGIYKDIGTAKKNFRDLYRNTEQAFQQDFPIIEKNVLDPFDESKGQYIKTLETELEDFRENVVSKFKEGSKADKAIQLYGEKNKTFAEIKDEFGVERANEIVQAERWFRSKYDSFIDNINEIEQQIYPNSPQKWTPKRADYFRHYQELTSDFSRLQNILQNPIRIDPMLEGISESTKPKSKWTSFKQQRTGDKTKVGAMRGYLGYLPSYSYALNIDQHIGKFRELADSLARADHKTKNMNNYINFLQQYSNHLAGKSTEIDRAVSGLTGRQAFQAIDWLNKRVKANTILGNASASLSQFLNIPQGIAKAGPINFIKGMYKSVAQIFEDSKVMDRSTFLKERYFRGFSEFDTKIFDQPKKATAWLVQIGDEIGTKMIWNAQFELAKDKGITNVDAAVRFADKETRKLVGGRGIGEKALVQDSKTFQVIAPFQLEVTNLWWVLEDIARGDDDLKKKLWQYFVLSVSLWMANNIIEKITGNRPVMDPIDMVWDSVNSLQDENYALAGGRIFGEALSNIPLGQTAAVLYPEYGMSIFGKQTPTRRELFGSSDPTRFGGAGPLVVKGVSDPFYKFVTPYGGNQLKKTVEGLASYMKSKSTASDGDFQYKIDKTPENFFKSVLFGKNATTNAQEYYEKKEAESNKSKGKSSAGRYTAI